MSQKKAVSDNQNLPLINFKNLIYLASRLIILTFLVINFILSTMKTLTMRGKCMY